MTRYADVWMQEQLGVEDDETPAAFEYLEDWDDYAESRLTISELVDRNGQKAAARKAKGKSGSSSAVSPDEQQRALELMGKHPQNAGIPGIAPPVVSGG